MKSRLSGCTNIVPIPHVPWSSSPPVKELALTVNHAAFSEGHICVWLPCYAWAWSAGRSCACVRACVHVFWEGWLLRYIKRALCQFLIFCKWLLIITPGNKGRRAFQRQHGRRLVSLMVVVLIKLVALRTCLPEVSLAGKLGRTYCYDPKNVHLHESCQRQGSQGIFKPETGT